MAYLSDIEIAQQAEMEPITEVAKRLDIDADDLELYGKYKAKVSFDLWEKVKDNEDGKLILVTAITPTPAGEGKTTTSVGLAQALAKLGKKVTLALREPSLGPVFGVKGGAAGGGYSQVVPMEDINIHFTGDFHAITSAHNLLAAMLDNSVQQGNPLNIDPRRIVFKRVLDMNDRALRNIVIGLGGKVYLLGRVSDEDLPAYYGACEVFCLSSVQKTEAFGIVQIEAMSCGKPVVATRIPQSGVAWVNRHGASGINVEPANAHALAEAITALTSDPQVYRRYAEGAARRYQELFTMERMVSGCLDIYNKVMS